MAKSDFKSVDEYIASQRPAVRGILERVRRAIRKGMPAAQEVISYRMPTYKLDGRPVLHFAGWKQHFSLYPASKGVVAMLKDDRSAFEINKRTIRFPLSEPVPVKLIERITKCRAKEVAQKPTR